MVLAILGVILSITSNAHALSFFKDNAVWIGFLLIAFGVVGTILAARRRPSAGPPKS
jgi:uncharacterized membrane protein YbaN (DUF454 family)